VLGQSLLILYSGNCLFHCNCWNSWERDSKLW